VGGFTLIELMLAVSILAIGTVMIQQGFLRASGLFHEASHRLAAQTWMETKLADAREQIVYAEPSSTQSESGTFEIAGRPYVWNLDIDLLPAGRDYYGLTLSVGWSEGGRDVRLLKNASALLRDKLQ